jgi:hypothetical protein
MKDQPKPNSENVSFSMEAILSVHAVSTETEKDNLLAGLSHLSKWGWQKEAQGIADLVSRLCNVLHQEWVVGDTPPVQDDAPYWISVVNLNTNHSFVELATYYKGPGWDNVFATDSSRFKIIAYCKASLPTPFQPKL